MNNTERRELVKWLRGEFRRLNRRDGEKSSPCIVYRPTHVVVEADKPDPRVNVPMAPPRCLTDNRSEAGMARYRELHGYGPRELPGRTFYPTERSAREGVARAAVAACAESELQTLIDNFSVDNFIVRVRGGYTADLSSVRQCVEACNPKEA